MWLACYFAVLSSKVLAAKQLLHEAKADCWDWEYVLGAIPKWRCQCCQACGNSDRDMTMWHAAARRISPDDSLPGLLMVHQRPEIQRVNQDLEWVCWSPKQIHRMKVQGQCFVFFCLLSDSFWRYFATGFLPAFSKVTDKQTPSVNTTSSCAFAVVICTGRSHCWNAGGRDGRTNQANTCGPCSYTVSLKSAFITPLIDINKAVGTPFPLLHVGSRLKLFWSLAVGCAGGEPWAIVTFGWPFFPHAGALNPGVFFFFAGMAWNWHIQWRLNLNSFHFQSLRLAKTSHSSCLCLITQWSLCDRTVNPNGSAAEHVTDESWCEVPCQIVSLCCKQVGGAWPSYNSQHLTTVDWYLQFSCQERDAHTHTFARAIYCDALFLIF